MSPEEIVDLVDFRYLTDALTPRRGAGDPRGARARPAERAELTPARRLPGVHDHARLARLRRREAGPAVPRGGRRRVHADQAQGRRRPRATTSRRLAHRARDGRAGHRDRRSTPTSAGTSPRRSSGSTSSRRTTSPGSRSRPAPTTSSATPRSPEAIAPIPVATGEHVANRVIVQAAAAGRAPSTSCRSTPPGSPGSTRTSPSCCSPRSSASGSARTPAASGCARRSSTCRCSTSSPCPATIDGRMIEYVDHLHEHFVTPVDVRHGCYWPPSAPGAGSEMISRTLADYSFPDGPVWSGAPVSLTTQH